MPAAPETPLRILVVVNLPWDVRLGATRVWAELAEQWRAAGHAVERFSLSEAFPAGAKSRAGFALQQLRFSRRAAAFIRKNAARFDVVDALVGTLPFSKRRLRFRGLLVARSVGLYLLYNRFERWAEKQWPVPRGRFAGRLLYGFIQRQTWRNSDRSIRHADLVNVPNAAEAECLREEIDPRLRIVVQPYGLTDPRARSFAAAATAAGRWKQQRVCFVGMWSPRKGSRDWPNIIALIRAEFPAARFKFLGTMVDSAKVRDDLGAMAAENAEFVSAYEPDDLPTLLADGTVGAFPSYVEGFGLAVIEKLAAGLPTVAYDTPGPRDILEKQLPELLVPSGDIERFAAAICGVLRLDAQAYDELSRRSVAAASAFSWPRIAAETLQEYVAALSEVAPGRSIR